jgi:L-alanine-DL-glutamate epimerase-like enolase superfamily enzyme
LRWQTTNEHFPVEEDGSVRVPQAPGLGVTLNSETIEKYRFVQ